MKLKELKLGGINNTLRKLTIDSVLKKSKVGHTKSADRSYVPRYNEIVYNIENL